MKYFVCLFLALTSCVYCQTPGNGVTDIDGNQYNSVNIGTQEWMKENLDVTKYKDGTIIPQVTDPQAWGALTTGAWRYFNNDPAIGSIYGKLYNWYAIVDPRGLAPEGWHVPTNAEWTTLTTYLGGDAVAGGKMKEVGTTHWTSPNIGATNESGFTALPGGYLDPTGDFCGNSIIGCDNQLTEVGRWWSSTEYLGSSARYFGLLYIWADTRRQYNVKTHGFSVRLINDIALNSNSFNISSFRTYPNPAKEQITIDLGNATNVNGWSYKIVNTLGQEVLYGDLNSQHNTVQLNNIKGHGVYFVKIYNSSNNLMDTKKIIIQQ